MKTLFTTTAAAALLAATLSAQANMVGNVEVTLLAEPACGNPTLPTWTAGSATPNLQGLPTVTGYGLPATPFHRWPALRRSGYFLAMFSAPDGKGGYVPSIANYTYATDEASARFVWGTPDAGYAVQRVVLLAADGMTVVGGFNSAQFLAAFPPHGKYPSYNVEVRAASGKPFQQLQFSTRNVSATPAMEIANVVPGSEVAGSCEDVK